MITFAFFTFISLLTLFFFPPSFQKRDQDVDVGGSGGVDGGDDLILGVSASAKRFKTGFKMTADAWRPDGVMADALTTKLVNELVSEGSNGFSSKLVPFVQLEEAASIVTVRGGLGGAASLWGLGLGGVSLPTADDSFNTMIKRMFGDLLANIKVEVIHGLNHFLTSVSDSVVFVV